MLFLSCQAKLTSNGNVSQILSDLHENFKQLDDLGLGSFKFKITYIKNVGNIRNFFIEFHLDKSEIEEILERSKESFNELLEISKKALDSVENTGFEKIFRFYDYSMLLTNKFVYDRLFWVEMKIREFLTYILIEQQEEFNEIFTKNSNLKIKSEKNLKGEYLRKRYENDLFYFDFSEYQRIGNFKKSIVHKIKQLLGEISTNSNLTMEEVRSKMEFILKKETLFKYKNEINIMLENFLKINKIRLKIAHARVLDPEEVPSEENYSLYQQISNIEEQINSILDKECIKVKKVISARIFLEQVGENIGVYRQNSTELEFEDGDFEEIDFGDFTVSGGEEEETADDFRKWLLQYLDENNYDIRDIDEDFIDVEFI